MNKNPIKLKFSRYEFKYYIPFYDLNEIISLIAKFTKLDTFNINKEPYVVRSLYYDSPTMTFFKEKIEGDSIRNKIRIRSYSHEQNNNLFLEIKSKKYDKIDKSREIITFDQYNEFNQANYNFLIDTNNKSNFLNNVYFLSNYYKIEPKVVIIYKRYSFIDDLANCKITFDFDLRASKSDNLFLNHKDFSDDLLSNSAIMEFKFEKLVPKYLTDIIKAKELSKITYSKYSNSYINII